MRDKNFFEQKVKFLFGDVMFDTVEEIIDDKSNKTTIMKWYEIKLYFKTKIYLQFFLVFFKNITIKLRCTG